MASRRDRDLQRYFDGELGPRRTRQVRQELERDEEQRRRLEGLETMRGALRESTQAATEEADFSRLWAGVQTGIEREEPPSFVEQLTFWLRRYGLVVASAMVVAAVTAVVLLRPMGTTPPRNDVVIESLDVGPEAVGTIFTIADPGGVGETTVIWVSETSAEGDDL